MNEISNMLLPNQEILVNLNDYIQKNASVKTWVGRVKVNNTSPIVVFSEARNELQTRSTTYNNTTRIINYNINIYCEKLVNSYEIVEELITLVTNVMQGYYNMTGGLTAMIPTFDDNKASYQANLRFTTRYIPRNKKLY